MRHRYSLATVLTLVTLISACGGGAKNPYVPGVEPVPKPTPAPTPTPTPSPSPTDGWVSGQVLLLWQAPIQRENGDPISINEIGGYEVRYRKKGQTDFTYIQYENNQADSHTFESLEGLYEFQVAVYDVNGLYSQFLNLTPYN